MQNSFFKNNSVNEYDLRVYATNISTIKFFRKIGVEEVQPEVNGKVIRMKGICKILIALTGARV